MHQSSMERMEWFRDKWISREGRVLDVGSRGYHSETYKHLFLPPKFEYHGMDVEPGPNVDLVVKSPYQWTEIPTDSFDYVISGQAFEHIEFPWITIQEMARVCKPGGKICIIAPNFQRLHRYPVDCWRFFPDGFIAYAKWSCLEVIHAHYASGPRKWRSQGLNDCMMIAVKPYSGEAKTPDLKTYKCEPEDLDLLRGKLKQGEPFKFTVKRWLQNGKVTGPVFDLYQRMRAEHDRATDCL
jgi:SAM-dependent methyltransferase